MRRSRAGRTAHGIARTWIPLPLVSAALLLGTAAPAEDAADVDDAKDEQIERELTTQASTLEAGFIYNHVGGNNPAFGTYTGLIDDKFYVLGNVDIFRREPWDSDSSQYYRLRGLNLGLRSRYADAEYGHQGLFALRFLYDELPTYKSETARSFFDGVGTTHLAIPDPGSWVAGTGVNFSQPPDPAPSFQDSVESNLRLIDIDWKRRKVGGDFSLVLPANLEFDAGYVYETKKGTKLMGAVIGQNGGDPRSVIIPERLDYHTQQINGALRYGGENLQLGLEYYGSGFDNDHDSQKWQVPFSGVSWAPTAGFCVDPDANGYCGTGSKGQMPDNWFHQIVASAGYSLPRRTRVTLSTAFSWMNQDQDFEPYTVNDNLAASITMPVPRNDLDGEIFTSIVDFGVSSRPLDKLRLDVGYRFEDRDNNTDRDTYVYIPSDADVQGDLTGGDARINLPYSLTRHEVSFDAGYQLPLRSELILGYDWEHIERDYQERKRVWENTLSAIFTGRPTSFMQTRIHYEHTWRDGSNYDGSRPFTKGHTSDFIDDEIADCAADGFTPAECVWENHPLLRKYYLADVHRDDVGGLVTLIPHEDVTIAANMSWRKDNYHDSGLGLTEFESLSPGAEVSYAPFDRLSTYAFYNYQWSSYKQNGWSFTGGGARLAQAMDLDRRWSSNEKTYTHTVGTGFDLEVIPNRLSFGVDYLFANSKGKIDVDRGSALTGFFSYPNTRSRQNNVSVHSEYHFTENFSMRVGYLFEKLSTKDYALDGITPTSLECGGFSQACVIGAGQESPDYEAHAVSWSLIYKFW